MVAISNHAWGLSPGVFFWRIISSMKSNAEHSADLTIVGAGAAGIEAAKIAQENGARVILLEGNDRPHGRINTDSHFVEHGAEFLHGVQSKTWEHVKEYGLTTISDGDVKNSYVYMEGKVQKNNQCEILIAKIREKAREHLSTKGETSADRIIKQVLHNLDIPEELKSTIRGAIESEYGARLRNLGLPGLQEPSSFEEENFRLEEGYSALLQRMSEGLDIRLHQNVQRIDWGNDVELTTGTGETFRSKGVISTIPAGILKQQPDLFMKPLPPEKIEAFGRIGVGEVWKIIATFRKRIWKEDMAVLRTPLLTQVWWPAHWGRSKPAPILTALIGANGVKKFGQSEDEASRIAFEELKLMFGASKVENALENIDVIPWTLDPHIRTGYSYLPPHANGIRKTLAEPVDGKLFFAGEATDPEAGTVHGAFNSGERAALEFLRSS